MDTALIISALIGGGVAATTPWAAHHLEQNPPDDPLHTKPPRPPTPARIITTATLGAVTAATLTTRTGWLDSGPLVVTAYSIWIYTALLVSIVDLDQWWLPRTALNAGTLTTLILFTARALTTHQTPRLLAAIGGATAWWALFLLAAHLGAFGRGDRRLARHLGLGLTWASPHLALAGLASALLTTAAGAAILLTLRIVHRRDHFPAGALITTGALLSLLISA